MKCKPHGLSDFYNLVRVECARWSPGSCGRKATGTALLLGLAGLALGCVQDAEAQDGLNVTSSREIHFTAGSGQVFELQGSHDMKSWRDTCDVVFGEGERVSDYLPPAERASGFRFFRVKISPAPAIGFAPAHLPGKQIVLNNEGEAQVLSFISRSLTAFGDGQFAYNYRKLSDTTARLELADSGSISERIDLDFRADLIGNYSRTSFSQDKVTDIEHGTFSLRNQSPQNTDPPVTTTPESLVGLTYLFSDGDNHERIDFVTEAGGRAVDGADVRYFVYDYAQVQNGASPVVTLHFRGEISVAYEMQPSTDGGGTCIRRESIDGVLEHSSEGIFSSATSIYHSAGADTTTTTLPADELTGRTYIMQDGGTPCRLKFETQQNGKCTEGTQVDNFEFDYVISCAVTSRVTVRFGPADYDAYYLNHSDQTFRRHEVRSGVEQDIDTGTFSESP